MGGIRFLVKPMIIVLTLYTSIAIHELGHFVGFKLNKIELRMINIAFISFIYNGEKWRITLNRNTANVGGIIVPNLGIVGDEKDFEKMQKGYANAILAGPVISLILIIIGGLLLMTKGYLLVVAGGLVIINLAMFLSCFIKADGVYGDFPAYKAYKDDDFFAALMMYQYAIFAVDYNRVRNKNTYLKALLLKDLKPRLRKRRRDLLTVSMVSTCITEYLVGMEDDLPEWIGAYIDDYYENHRAIIASHRAEANKQLLLYIAYYYKEIGLEDQAVSIYKNVIKKLPQSEVFDYWKIQGEQIIMGKDHSTYLLNKKNIKPSLAYGVFKQLEGFYHDELILNKRII